MLRKVKYLILTLLVLAGCDTQSVGSTNPTGPTLAVTPTSININAGGEAITFSALVQNSSEAVAWTLSGPGSVTPASRPSTVYTPPGSIDSAQGASLTATLGATGATATAPIAIYPASVTPPDEPPPSQPPSNPPTNPPTNPPPPTDPPTNPPPNPPPPTDPPPPNNQEPTVDIQGEVSQTATVLIPKEFVAVGSDPDGDTLTYQWSVNVGDPTTVTFSSPTSSTTTATFAEPGYHSIRVRVTDPGGLSDTDDVDVEVTRKAGNNVTGIWDGTFNEGSAPFSMALMARDSDNVGTRDVTGTFTYNSGQTTFPVSGTITAGGVLTLTGNYVNGTARVDASVDGDTMEGTATFMATGGGTSTFTFTATKTPKTLGF